MKWKSSEVSKPVHEDVMSDNQKLQSLSCPKPMDVVNGCIYVNMQMGIHLSKLFPICGFILRMNPEYNKGRNSLKGD